MTEGHISPKWCLFGVSVAVTSQEPRAQYRLISPGSTADSICKPVLIVVSVLIPFISQYNADLGVRGMMTRARPSNSIIHSATLESGCSAAANEGGQTQLCADCHCINHHYLWKPINLSSKWLLQRAWRAIKFSLVWTAFVTCLT